jgi:RHS repeat-associated protein
MSLWQNCYPGPRVTTSKTALGSVTSLSASSASLANTYSYDSFGRLAASTGTVTNRFQYTGRQFDPETGIYFYRARYHNPTFGRFISEDPIGFAGGINKHAYVGNSPTNWTDPFGLRPATNIRVTGVLGGMRKMITIPYPDGGTWSTEDSRTRIPTARTHTPIRAQTTTLALPFIRSPCQLLFAWGRSTARVKRKECAFHSPIC